MTEKKLIPFLSLVFSLFFVSYSFAAEVHFQWGTSSGVVEGYKIYYGSSHEGPYPNLLDEIEGTATECLATLNEGADYYLVVRAYNDYGESGDSNEVKWPSEEGDSNTIVFGDASGADYPGTIQDTFININDENSVNSESLNTYTWPTDQVANAIILKADLAAIPDGAYVQSATLHLNMNSMGGNGGDDLYDISAHKIINYNPNLSQCTGYTYDSINAWTPNSSCYDDIPLAQSDIAAEEDVKSIDKTYSYKTWDVTNMVRDWIANPNMNFGLLLNSDISASSDSNRFFASSEASDPNQRPKLVVTYTTDTDPTPPRDITNAIIVGFDGNALGLGWTNPASRDKNGELIPENQDFQGVMIRYNIGYDAPYPANYTEGTLFKDEYGNLDEFDSCEGTVNGRGKIYRFSFFTHDDKGHYSTTVHLLVDTMSPPPPVNVSPTIDGFTGMPASLNNPGETVTLNAFATDQDGDSLTYTINFGDGTAGQSGSEAIHTYASAGTYTADVTVDDGHGNTVGKALQITVNDVPPAKPTSVIIK
jgi:hypothetical protein